jgi:hypothetical protein
LEGGFVRERTCDETKPSGVGRFGIHIKRIFEVGKRIDGIRSGVHKRAFVREY